MTPAAAGVGGQLTPHPAVGVHGRFDKYRRLGTLSFMDVEGRTRVAKVAGYALLSQDDGQEIYGRDDLPSTVEFDGIEWTLHLRDFNLDPVGHQHLGDARLHPAVAFEALMELDPAQLDDWML
jgi:hypothetical protein